jgi:CRP-like cAMP-binding protein
VNRIEILRELDEKQIALLKPLLQTFSCPAGTVVFQQGERADFLYFVTEGNIDISFKPYDGSPITIGHVGKGGFCGWSAVVGSKTYTSTAIAIEDVQALRVHGDELRQFCVEHPEIGKYILERLADGVSERWKDAHKQVQSILFQGLKEKSGSS